MAHSDRDSTTSTFRATSTQVAGETFVARTDEPGTLVMMALRDDSVSVSDKEGRSLSRKLEDIGLTPDGVLDVFFRGAVLTHGACRALVAEFCHTYAPGTERFAEYLRERCDLKIFVYGVDERTQEELTLCARAAEKTSRVADRMFDPSVSFIRTSRPPIAMGFLTGLDSMKTVNLPCIMTETRAPNAYQKFRDDLIVQGLNALAEDLLRVPLQKRQSPNFVDRFRNLLKTDRGSR